MLEQLIRLYTASMMQDVRSPIPHLAGPPGTNKSGVAQQLADLTAVVSANGRAQALQSAEQAAAAAQGQEQRRRFLTQGTGYQPGNAQMFYGNN